MDLRGNGAIHSHGIKELKTVYVTVGRFVGSDIWASQIANHHTKILQVIVTKKCKSSSPKMQDLKSNALLSGRNYCSFRNQKQFVV